MELSTIIVAHKEVEIKFDGPRREPRRPGGPCLAGYRAAVAAKRYYFIFLII
jgi:hypothetical protein